MRKVAIIGTGFIGRAWAICFARGGYEARLWDAVPAAVDNAVGYIEPILDDLAANDLLGGWSLAGVSSFYAGDPVTFTYTAGTAAQVSGIQQD